MTQGPALASGGRTCLDPGTFIFTTFYGKRSAKFQKDCNFFDDRELRDKANGSDLKIPFTPPHRSTPSVTEGGGLRAGTAGIGFGPLPGNQALGFALNRDRAFPTKNCWSLELPQTACLTRDASLHAIPEPANHAWSAD